MKEDNFYVCLNLSYASYNLTNIVVCLDNLLSIKNFYANIKVVTP